MTTDALVPFDVAAEEAIVASVLVDDTAIAAVEGIVRPEHFYRDQNRWAFEGALALWRRGSTVNQVTLASELGARLDDVGGLPYLARIVGDLVTPVGVEHYAHIVRRCAAYRAAISVGSQIVQTAYTAPADLNDTLTKFERLVQTLRDDAPQQRDLTRLGELVEGYWERPDATEATSEAGPQLGSSGGLFTGFTAIDGIVERGFRDSNLIIVGARPSLGKSALLLNVSRNVAMAQNARVAIFSAEMSHAEVRDRFLAAESGISGARITGKDLTTDEERRLMNATADLDPLAIYIDDSETLTVPTMRSKLRKLAAAIGGVDLVVVDYLQLIKGANSGWNRTQEVSDVSRDLKMLAREMGAPVLAASQLNRNVDERPDHRPRLSDLRESGSIEQDADVVMFLYREAQYISPREWGQKHPGEPYPLGLTEVIVEKQRNGATGTAHLHFHHQLARFENFTAAGEMSQGELIPEEVTA